MEDIEKYTFDPENPSKFKAYNLLKKIIKDQDNVVFLDPYFFAEIFEKEIFDEETIEEIWDKPENFTELGGAEKTELYIKNHSERDFGDLLLKKWENIDFEKLKNNFSNFYNLTQRIPVHDGNGRIAYYTNELKIDENINKEFYIHFFSNSLGSNFKFEQAFNKNVVLFLLSRNLDSIIENINYKKSSVVITTSYNEFVIDNELPEYLRPILLPKMSMLPQLLDFIQRDINQEKKAKLPKQEITYLDSLHLSNYFSLGNIEITDLKDKKEIYFLGENGEGKSILLQGIVLALKGNQNIGVVSDMVKQNTQENLRLEAKDSKGKNYNYQENPKEQGNSYQNLFAYGVNRFRNDTDSKDTEGYLTLFNHEQFLESPEKWLQHLDYKEAKNGDSGISLATAKEFLRDLLEKDIEIEVSPNNVTFTEKDTKALRFDQLSDGYKTVMIFLCDLLARFSENQPNASEIQEFQGIVLIDEIGMFLHPKWQYKVVKNLRKWFPRIQFIFTSHSPMTVLGSSKDAVFYKAYKEKGITQVSEAIEHKVIRNLMANGVLTAPFLFGLESIAQEDSEAENLDTSEDYLTGKISEEISRRLAQKNHISEDDIMKLIQEELDKFEAENDKN